VEWFADRLIGSPSLYGHEQREPEASVNSVTCHDGFTLNDLVSYDRKHNGANGEHDRDGADDNQSWNCAVEGPTESAANDKLRHLPRFSSRHPRVGLHPSPATPIACLRSVGRALAALEADGDE
jgi:pullulanase/glycogen debranching enzyme